MVVALSPDGSRAAAVTIEGTVYVWDVATGQGAKRSDRQLPMGTAATSLQAVAPARLGLPQPQGALPVASEGGEQATVRRKREVHDGLAVIAG